MNLTDFLRALVNTIGSQALLERYLKGQPQQADPRAIMPQPVVAPVDEAAYMPPVGQTDGGYPFTPAPPVGQSSTVAPQPLGYPDDFLPPVGQRYRIQI